MLSCENTKNQNFAGEGMMMIIHECICFIEKGVANMYPSPYFVDEYIRYKQYANMYRHVTTGKGNVRNSSSSKGVK